MISVGISMLRSDKNHIQSNTKSRSHIKYIIYDNFFVSHIEEGKKLNIYLI